MKMKLAQLGLVPALTLAAASANAAQIIVPLDGPGQTIATKFFATTDTGPGDSFVADFGATPKLAAFPGHVGMFDYVFEFTTPVSGAGGGSFSGSFSASSAITSVSFDGAQYTYPTSGQTLVVLPFTVTSGILNKIEVIGYLHGARSLTFDGTAVFTANVPEPTTWAMCLVGFGFMGFGLRSKTNKQLQTA